MATINLVTSCCGFRDFGGVRDKSPKTILKEVLACKGVASHILFTDRAAAKEIPDLVQVVEALGLGQIVRGPVAENPQTGHNITGWIFVPNYRKIQTFVENF